MVIPVFIVLLCLCYYAINSEKRKLSMGKELGLIILLSIIITFRPELMPDYQNYLNLFVNEPDTKEFGYLLMVKTTKHLNSNPLAIFFVGALISVGLKISAIKRCSKLIWLSLAVYVSNYYILHDMIQLRCAIASGLFLWSIYYLTANKKNYSIFCSLLAVLFHYSAIVIFVIYLININTINRKVVFISLLSSYILAIFGIRFGYLWGAIPLGQYAHLWEIYSNKIDEGELSSINIFNIVFIFRYILCFVLLFYVNKLVTSNKNSIVLIKLYCLSIVLFLLLSDIPVLAFRISELFQIVEVFLIPNLCCVFRKHKTGVAFAILVSLSFFSLNVFINKLLL